MTDTEMTHALLDRVMGLTVYTDEVDWRVHCLNERGKAITACCLKEDGTVLLFVRPFGIRPWRPLESMDDAWMLVGALQGAGWDYTLGSVFTEDGEGHSALFERGALSLYDDTREEAHEATAPTPQRAICLAALKVAGVEVEG